MSLGVAGRDTLRGKNDINPFSSSIAVSISSRLKNPFMRHCVRNSFKSYFGCFEIIIEQFSFIHECNRLTGEKTACLYVF